MFLSLTSRLAAVSVLVIIALLALVAAMVDASRQSRESFRRVMHSSAVIQTMDDTLGSVREAESGQRGFILTQNPGFAQNFDRRVEDARVSYRELYRLTEDNEAQHVRLQEFGKLLEERVELMRTPLERARQSAFDDARLALIEGRGHETMGAMNLLAQEFLIEERALQERRIAAAERRIAWGRTLALVGGPLIALFSFLVSVILIRGIRQPVRVLDSAMNRLGSGNLNDRIVEKLGSREFNRLAAGYNRMAQQLDDASRDQMLSEQELKSVHAELVNQSAMMKSRGDVIELLGAMAHRMQATRTDEELAEIISIFVPRVLPDLPGALYAHNNSRNLLVPKCQWDNPANLIESFSPNECWALRRGQRHYVSGEGKDIHCEHVPDHTAIYHCEPLLAAGEVIGVLYLEGLLDEEARFRMTVLSENIASAMVNRRLQRDLKEQSIRDPLTGLFNRRYMQEALALEVARSARSEAPLCVVMCDVDHFKRFNDQFGHDAGDAVLQSVGSILLNQFRDGDIVCRFGGEEFTIIAPGTSQEDLIRRVEGVRLAIANAAPSLKGQSLGNITMSFGVAQWGPSMDKTGSELLSAADAALYQAKHQGRNRIVGHQNDAA